MFHGFKSRLCLCPGTWPSKRPTSGSKSSSSAQYEQKLSRKPHTLIFGFLTINIKASGGDLTFKARTRAHARRVTELSSAWSRLVIAGAADATLIAYGQCCNMRQQDSSVSPIKTSYDADHTNPGHGRIKDAWGRRAVPSQLASKAVVSALQKSKPWPCELNIIRPTQKTSNKASR